MSEQNKIDEIKAALAAATTGRWYVVETNDYTAVFSENESEISVVTANSLPQDAALIAKTREYITYLLAEIERKDEALRFYAQESSYDKEFDGLIPVMDDAGDKARDAL